MERGGTFETGQHGFRPHKQTRSPISKLQYVIHDAKKHKRSVVVAYLDWFGAFSSVSLDKLYQSLEAIGMHPSD
eukprot:2635361-Rhodomonas_salina.1